MCSKITIKRPEQRCRQQSGNYIVNFKQFSQLSLVFLVFTLNSQSFLGVTSITGH